MNQDESTQTTPLRRKPKAARHARGRQIGRVVALLAVAALVVDALVGERGPLAMFRVRHQYEELAASIARQRAENAWLREEVRRLREDPAAIEEVARRELGLIRPGEKVFIVKDLKPAPSRP